MKRSDHGRRVTSVVVALMSVTPGVLFAQPRVMQLQAALENGDETTVAAVLRRSPALATVWLDSVGCQPIHIASRRGDSGIVRILLRYGASLTSRDVGGRSPLVVAAYEGHAGVLRVMIARRSPRRPEIAQYYAEAVCAACEQGHRSVVRLILDAGFDPNQSTGDGMLPLFCAVRAGWLDLARQMIGRGADPMVGSRGGGEFGTLWHAMAGVRADEADRRSDSAIIRWLDSLGINVDAVDRDYETALHIAAENDNALLIRHLLDRGASAVKANYRGETPLHVAAFHGRLHAIAELVRDGVPVDIADAQSGVPPLFDAISGDDSAAVALLLAHGANARFTTRYGTTPLHQAASESPGITRLLLAAGADPNAASADGSTPLHGVAISSDAEDTAVATMLVTAGAAIDAADDRGRTPLHNAAWSGSTAMLRWLLDRGADLERADTSGRTALLLACEAGQMPALRQLLDRGAEWARTRSGQTALHLALGRGNEAVVDELLERGADPNVADSAGETPLHVAALWAPGSIERLLASGADPAARDSMGRTPLALARYTLGRTSRGSNQGVQRAVAILAKHSAPE